MTLARPAAETATRPAAITRTAGVLRLGFALLCVCLALLAVVRAPTYWLWQLRVLISEGGIWIGVLSLLVFVGGGWRRTKAGRAAAALSVLALILTATPWLRAALVAGDVSADIARAFPVATEPPDAQDMAVEPTTHTYASYSDALLQLDLYRAGESGKAVFVVIHGGAWRSGDRLQAPRLNGELARRGYNVVSIDYRLAPAHPFPAALEDVTRAIAWIKDNATLLDVDASRIVLFGRSAGGHLALLAAYTLNDPAIRGAVSYYGPADLRWGWDNPSNPRVIDSRLMLGDFLGGTPAERGSTFDQASPVNFTRSAVPTLLVHGDMDEMVSSEHAVRVAAGLSRNGVRHVFVRLPWATHGCDYLAWGPCGRIAMGALERFLAAVVAER
jgi:acetyl esterase/lipase